MLAFPCLLLLPLSVPLLDVHREMALEAARVVFDEKIVLALEPVRKDLDDNQRQCRDVRTAELTTMPKQT